MIAVMPSRMKNATNTIVRVSTRDRQCHPRERGGQLPRGTGGKRGAVAPSPEVGGFGQPSNCRFPVAYSVSSRCLESQPDHAFARYSNGGGACARPPRLLHVIYG